MREAVVVYQFFVYCLIEVQCLKPSLISFIFKATVLGNNDSKFNQRFCSSLDKAKSYAEVWKIVKETAEFAVGKRRDSMMLFLDDLTLQLGAYYPVGTNNIVLNRALVEIVEASMSDKPTVNALIYNLLLHEYLHALGDLSETGVRRQVVEVAKKSFGEQHIATVIACKSPWVLLKDIPIGPFSAPKRVMEIVRDFEKTSKYIV
jgi:hypothetical protein